MKNLKKNILTALAFIFAFTAALGLDVSNLTEVPLYREIPGTFYMENITTMCTLNGPGILCSVAGWPSEDELYWHDQAKTIPITGISASSVFMAYW